MNAAPSPTPSPAVPSPIAAVKRTWVFWLKLTVMLLIVVGLGLAMRKSLMLLRETGGDWKLLYGWFIAATGVYILSLLPSGIFFHAGMLGLGQHPGWYRAIRAYYIGHLGKYVPGKAMVPILRAGLVCGPRVSVAAAVAAVFLETLTWIAAGAFWGVACLVGVYRDAADQRLLVAAVAIALCTMLPTLPPIFRFALTVLGKIFPRKAAALDDLKRLRFRTLAFGWLCSSVAWWGMGLSFWMVLRSIGLIGLDDLFPLRTIPFCMMTISLAVSVSFLILPLPGGLGVRETIIYAMIVAVFFASGNGAESGAGADQNIAKAIAALSAVLFRIISLGGEAFISAILYAIRPAPEPDALSSTGPSETGIDS